MPKRFFFRRVIAYVLDLFLVSIAFAFLALFAGPVLGIKVIAPDLVTFTTCEPREILTVDRMQELLPISEGQAHQQSLCATTTMGLTTFHTVVLTRVGSDSSGNFLHTTLEYAVDQSGNRVTVYSMESLLWLVAPALFAMMITMRGRTFGKQALGLMVGYGKFSNPNLKTVLKREYLKVLPFVLLGLFEIYGLFQNSNADLDQMAAALNTQNEEILKSGAGVWVEISVVLVGVLAVTWYHFGSFVFWNGQSYWDRWTDLYIYKPDDLNDKT